METTRKLTLQIPFPSLDHFNWELANTLHLCFKTTRILRKGWAIVLGNIRELKHHVYSNLYHVTKFPLYLSFTVNYFYTC